MMQHYCLNAMGSNDLNSTNWEFEFKKQEAFDLFGERWNFDWKYYAQQRDGKSADSNDQRSCA